MRFGGLRPSPIAIAGLIGLLWAISSRALRDFIWADLREGMLDLRALPRNARLLARAGLVVLGVIVVALLFNDFWRANSPLVALTGTRIFRGQLLPIALLPTTLFLLVVAWSFVLAGALHVHWLVRLTFLTIYSLTAIGWANSLVASGGRMELLAAGASIAGVVLVFILRWRAEPRPVLEFATMFVLVAVIFLLAQRQELRTQEIFGIPTGIAKISFNVNLLGGLITPLLLMIGMNIADFARRASHWTGDILTARAPRWLALGVLVGLLGWRLFFAWTETLEQVAQAPAAEQLRGIFGAVGELVVVAFVWWLTRVWQRSAPDEETMSNEVQPIARPLVLGYSAVQLLAFVLLLLLMAVTTGTWAAGIQHLLFGAVDFLNNRAATVWHFVFSVGAVAACVILTRRDQRALALYLGIFGALNLWWSLTSRGQVLAFFSAATHQQVELCWTLVFAAAAVWWTLRRELTPARVTRLVVVLLILTLMRQRDFIENPFSPFFGFAGVGFIAFSLVWDIATSGAWTNADSPRLPRVNRVFLYIGAILMTGTVLNWAVTIHDLDTVKKFTGGVALTGFDRFGLPLIYGAFAIALALPARRSGAD